MGDRITTNDAYGKSLLARLGDRILSVKKSPDKWKKGFLDELELWKNILTTTGIDYGSQHTKVLGLVAEARYDDPIFMD